MAYETRLTFPSSVWVPETGKGNKMKLVISTLLLHLFQHDLLAPKLWIFISSKEYNISVHCDMPRHIYIKW